MAKQVTYELRLPFHKQGDDLAKLLEEGTTTTAALEKYAEVMDASANILRQVAERTKGQRIEISADAHVVTIRGSKNVLSPLADDGLLHELEDE